MSAVGDLAALAAYGIAIAVMLRRGFPVWLSVALVSLVVFGVLVQAALP